MIRRARWRLLAYVTVVLALVLLAAGTVVYGLLARQLDAAVDDQLRALAAPLAAPGPPLAQTNELAGIPAGAFVLRSFGGRELARSADAPAALDPAAVDAARARGDDLRTVTIDGQRYRLLTLVSGGRGPGIVTQAGLSLAERERQHWLVLVALAGGGALGLALTGAGAFFLTSRALQPVEQAFDRQRRFVSDASHEFRTPLALLRMEAEALAGRDQVDPRPLLREVDRLARLVSDLLALAQLDEGALRIEAEPVPVAPLLATAADETRRLAPLADVSVHAAPGLWVLGDPARLRQVLLILADNAARVTPPGGRIAFSAARRGASVEIEVSDSGPGIPAEHAARIFERFFRADRARARAAGGAGLGLSIARELMVAHGGAIALANPGTPGATLVLRLRALDPDAAALGDDVTSTVEAAAAPEH